MRHALAIAMVSILIVPVVQADPTPDPPSPIEEIIDTVEDLVAKVAPGVVTCRNVPPAQYIACVGQAAGEYVCVEFQATSGISPSQINAVPAWRYKKSTISMPGPGYEMQGSYIYVGPGIWSIGVELDGVIGC